jgi:hypothetical protein
MGVGGSAAGHTVNVVDLLLDTVGEGDGVEPAPEGDELGQTVGIALALAHKAVQWCGRGVVDAADAGADPFLADELHRGLT